MNRLAQKFLRYAEILFLRAHGWKRSPSGTGWDAPLDHPKPHRGIPRNHAVSSQKKINSKESP